MFAAFDTIKATHISAVGGIHYMGGVYSTGMPGWPKHETQTGTNPPTTSPTKQPTGPTVVKYLCSKNDPGDTEICLLGEGSLGSACLEEGISCGNGGKVCWLAECSGGPPSPTPPPPAPTGCEPVDGPCNDGIDCCSGK